jgi:hypothetical protein
VVIEQLDRGQVSNGAQPSIAEGEPYTVTVTVRGVAPLLFHAWNNEAVEEKAKAGKNTAQKKTDNVESYVYRDPNGNIGIPGKNFYASIVEAGRFIQDPRSPRKSARDLCRAAIVPLTIVAPFEPAVPTWDYLDRQRVTVQRSGITRVRPAMAEGWRVTFDLLVNLPEYISATLLTKLIGDAGRLVGVCDYRPTYGRFALVGFEASAV